MVNVIPGIRHTSTLPYYQCHGTANACTDCHDCHSRTHHSGHLAATDESVADGNARQGHVLTPGGTETPTPGYTFWNLSLGTDILLRSGRKFCQVSVSVSNLFDKGYQSHLSRLKYADTYPLTGRYGYNDMGRDITVRLSFPFDF